MWQKANGYWFWDRWGVLPVVFMNPGATITSEVYCETLKQLRAIQNRWHGLLTSYIMFRDHAWPHCCVRSPAAQAGQVRIVRPSVIHSGPGSQQFSCVPSPQNFPSIAELHRQQVAEINSGKLVKHRRHPSMMRGCVIWCPAMISASILAVTI
jgi:hypothetical protein